MGVDDGDYRIDGRIAAGPGPSLEPPIRVLFSDASYLDLPETTRCVWTGDHINGREDQRPAEYAAVEIAQDGLATFLGVRSGTRCHTLADELWESTRLLYVELPERRWRLGRVEPLDRTVRRLWRQLHGAGAAPKVDS